VRGHISGEDGKRAADHRDGAVGMMTRTAPVDLAKASLQSSRQDGISLSTRQKGHVIRDGR
jgi:hypothetical protein